MRQRNHFPAPLEIRERITRKLQRMRFTEASRSRAGPAFLLGFILLAAGIVSTGWLYYRNYEKQFRIGIEQQLSAIADLKAADLAQYRKERLEDGSMFFQNAPFAALVRRFLEKPEDAEAQRQIQIWIGKYQPTMTRFACWMPRA